MDVWVFLFLVSVTLIMCVVRLLRPHISVYERAFLLMLIGSISYVAWDRHSQFSLDVVQTKDKVTKILDLIKEDLSSHDLEMKVPFEKVLASDPQLLRALLALTKYASFDRDSINSVIRSMVEFYELYADILLEVKSVRAHIKTLVDMRYRMLQDLHTLYVSFPQSKHIAVFEHISLVLRSSTYKSLNVLKNKYGITDHEPPLAENVLDGEYAPSSRN